jgi:hypothetical protein
MNKEIMNMSNEQFLEFEKKQSMEAFLLAVDENRLVVKVAEGTKSTIELFMIYTISNGDKMVYGMKKLDSQKLTGGQYNKGVHIIANYAQREYGRGARDYFVLKQRLIEI